MQISNLHLTLKFFPTYISYCIYSCENTWNYPLCFAAAESYENFSYFPKNCDRPIQDPWTRSLQNLDTALNHQLKIIQI